MCYIHIEILPPSRTSSNTSSVSHGAGPAKDVPTPYTSGGHTNRVVKKIFSAEGHKQQHGLLLGAPGSRTNTAAVYASNMRHSFPYAFADRLVEDKTPSAALPTCSRFGIHIKLIVIWVLEINPGGCCGTRLRRWWGRIIVGSNGSFTTLAQRRSFLM